MTRESVTAIENALLQSPCDHTEPLHQRVERECWKQHPNDFGVCEHPACVMLKRIANLIGWCVEINGVAPPPPAALAPPLDADARAAREPGRDEPRRVATFKGRPVTDLTREELIEAYTKVCVEVANERRSNLQSLDMDRELRDARARMRRARRPVW